MAAQDDGSLLETAASYIRGGAATDSERAQGEVGETIRQIRLLREWADQAGPLISSVFFQRLKLVSERTSEHRVFFDPGQNRAIKQTWPGQFGWLPKLEKERWTLGIANPLDYFDRWILFNRVFGDKVRLEGIISGQSMVIGDRTETISVVISQHWHQAADLDDPEVSAVEISRFLRKLGFEPIENSFYGWLRTADDIVVLDARPDNFIKTKDGIAPIDLPMTRTV